MEFDTFSHINFIIKTEELERVISKENAFSSFLFDIESPSSVHSVFSLIFSKSNPEAFTITIPVTQRSSIEEDWLNKLCLVLSHYGYKRHNNKLIIGILGERDLHHSRGMFSQKLAFELSKQNFEFLLVELDQLRGDGSERPFAYFENLELSDDLFYNWYKGRLTNDSSFLNLFYNVNTEAIDKVLLQKERAEKRMMREDPILYKLIQHDNMFAKKEQLLKTTIENLTTDLSSKAAYLDFLLAKNSDELSNSGIDLIPSMRIKKFYHNEYEILPLWYKRFGHILKVIMGKRTFRSLFKDNVKKYKD
jgi:hypothetical protein